MSLLDDLVTGVAGAIDKAVEIVSDNPGQAASVVGIAAATVATGGLALACAPAIGAAVSAAGFGVAGGSLTGAAASSAGLAALGGGSLASGGFGMAGGTAVVTTVGGLTGAAVGSGVCASMNGGRDTPPQSKSSFSHQLESRVTQNNSAAFNVFSNFGFKDTRSAAQKKVDSSQAYFKQWVSSGANKTS